MTRPTLTHSHPICPTCQSDLTGKEYPEYFAQSGSTLEDDDIGGWSDDIDKLVTFTRAVCDALHALPCARDHIMELDDTPRHLAALGWELVKEIERRASGLYIAGQIWQRRAEGKED